MEQSGPPLKLWGCSKWKALETAAGLADSAGWRRVRAVVGSVRECSQAQGAEGSVTREEFAFSGVWAAPFGNDGGCLNLVAVLAHLIGVLAHLVVTLSRGCVNCGARTQTSSGVGGVTVMLTPVLSGGHSPGQNSHLDFFGCSAGTYHTGTRDHMLVEATGLADSRAAGTTGHVSTTQRL